MAADATPRGEIQSFQHYIFGTIDSIVGALEGLSAEELNWRPAAPEANSLYACQRRTCSATPRRT